MEALKAAVEEDSSTYEVQPFIFFFITFEPRVE
jgi:hypothetical protein